MISCVYVCVLTIIIIFHILLKTYLKILKIHENQENSWIGDETILTITRLETLLILMSSSSSSSQ